MDKDGNIRTKPLNAQTLCRIAETVFDKRQLIRGLPTAVTNEGSKLAELAEKLEQLGRAQAARTIEMEPTGCNPAVQQGRQVGGPTDTFEL